MYRRFGGEVTVVEMGAAADRARGRGRLRRRQGILEDEGHRRPARTPNASASRSTRRRSSRRRLHGRRAGGRRLAPAAGGRAGGRTPTISASTRPASRPTRAATSWSTTSCAPTCPASGRSATATARRLHPHRLQRLRDRRGQPARRRSAPRQRPHPGLRALHRPAARPRRHDRGRGAQDRAGRRWSARGR